jgi:DNA helicase-2/ATP-dependent DNA helicase PcrA
VQYAFVRLLAGDSGQVFVVGDDDQAIYGWRGAKVENVQRFLRDYPGAQTFKLEQNYRSTGHILAAANAVIAHNPQRLGKQLWTASGEGDPIDLSLAYSEVDEARFVVERIRAWIERRRRRRCAVLYRSNAQSRAFEEQLGQARLPTACTAACASSSAWNQGRDGLPAPGRQPRRRLRLRARGQHAAARHRRPHHRRSAAAGARAGRVAVAGGGAAVRGAAGAAMALAGARAMRCAASRR